MVADPRYATALFPTLPHAARVLDCVHMVTLGFTAVEDVRRCVQQDTHGHRGRVGDPLHGIRRVLRRGAENLTDRAWDRLLVGLADGDPDGQVATAWIAAEELLHRLLVHCADSEVPELSCLARTLDAWRDELLARVDHPEISHEPTEAINLLMKKIKRVGHGFRNLENYRIRLVLHCSVT